MISIIIFCISWYLMGFASFIILEKIETGCVWVADVVAAFFAGFFGPIITMQIILKYIDESDLMSKRLF